MTKQTVDNFYNQQVPYYKNGKQLIERLYEKKYDLFIKLSTIRTNGRRVKMNN